MFNQQFLHDFYNGGYCPSDNAGSKVEKQLFKRLDRKSRKLLTQLIEYRNEELNDFAFRAYFDGIGFATTILMNSLDEGD